MLLARLERVPVDSFWAHRASGLRGSLLAALDDKPSTKAFDPRMVDQLVWEALRILERAATEQTRAGQGTRAEKRGPEQM